MAVAASRLLCSSRPLKFDSSSSSSSARSVHVSGSTFQRTVEMKKNRKVVVAKCSLSENAILERETEGGVRGLGSVAADVAKAALGLIKPRVNRKSGPVQAEIILETGILNCRFFTLFAVAGSLIGSILCFLEGCFLILESFYQYFQNMSQRSHQGEVMHLLVEALDFFLVGNAMLIFGVGIYVMFVGSKEMNRNKGSLNPGSNFFGFFHLKRLPSWVHIQSLSQAKTGIGHSVVMILQAGVIDKLKDVPMTSVLDLACLAGTILLSSACIFLLSRLSNNNNKST
ncbi:hypothetical protein MRB53_029541 [Persea americana]|uniref:Uncharacterized protein n=1 Tax=Persea americana TaxID=3435 RepID=A0ACC2KIN3_PERAE|nr:hypothetical protein MRB53_029541 [Persea americana]